MGTIDVPSHRLWGAQTQRSLEHFPIGQVRFKWPRSMIRAFGLLKKCAAESNVELGKLDPKIAEHIVKAASEVADGKWDDEFPLVVFQTGSGTQSNMNANEVIAFRACQLLNTEGGNKKIHPNDHVNKGQSSNDTFPTAMHMAIVSELHSHLFPAVDSLSATFEQLSQKYETVVKCGRTHLQDATPITLGQEISGWKTQLEFAREQITNSLPGLYDLAVGGTAVGTGLNAHPQFGEKCAAKIADKTGHPFRSAPNKFFSLSAHEAVVQCSAALRALALSLIKITNDIRWLSSGPRCGIGELRIPENEPGSSIMPGKVNPTQCEALHMVCLQVFGNDATIAFAGSQGNFQLNVCKPVMAHNCLESIQLLGDALVSFDRYCARGIEPNKETITNHLNQNLMLVTALAPHIGYDDAAKIAKIAEKENLSLKEAALQHDAITEKEFDEWVQPVKMT